MATFSGPKVLPQVDLIDGEWHPAEMRLPHTLQDPNTGVVLQAQMGTRPDLVERAIRAADHLFSGFRGAFAPVAVRAALLDLIAEGIEIVVDDLAYQDSMSTGNPITTTRCMAGALGPRVRSARDQMLGISPSTPLSAGGRTVRLLRQPLGPAAMLAPWNAPTFVAVAKVASALAAGCPVILKPSEWAPGGCQMVAEIVAQATRQLDLPAAVFQLVHGASRVGSQLASDPRVRAVAFTGGGQGGRSVAAAAAPHFAALQLELGGHNPAIVLEDADIAATATALASGVIKLNGQWCEAPGKVLVPGSHHDELVDRLLEQLGNRRVGHCLDPKTEVGPLAYSLHRDRLATLVGDLVRRGGEANTRSQLPDMPGWFFPPTIVTGLAAEDSVHELFGPVLTIHSVRTVDEAIEAVAGGETGLAGFVFGSDEEAALAVAAQIPVGEVRVNGCHLSDLAEGSEQDFWNSAGYGGHGPTDMVRFFQGRRVIGVDDPRAPI